mmetsp:Transcript_18557/g.33529  ORF Transcript_18557/g.33529 Transcript_18557/m.33529 type:complete len:121 (-) Transcript_18557:898-1260(-)
MLFLPALRSHYQEQADRRQSTDALLTFVAQQLVRDLHSHQLIVESLEELVELRQSTMASVERLPHVEATAAHSCCICLEFVEPPAVVTVLPCNHAFHSGCVDNWLQYKPCCPLCKEELEL